MRRLLRLLLLVTTSFSVGCKTTSPSSNDYSSTKAAGSNGTKLTPPPPESKDNDLDVDAVVKYMVDYRKRFIEDKKYLFVAPGVTPPGIEDMQNCIGNNPPYWSPLVRHFFCMHGSYQGIVPNMRGCFSKLAGGKAVNGRGWYPEIFDFCTYQDYDAVINAGKTKFDLNTLVANKNAGNKVGVMKYLTADEEEVFKYVLWTWYNPFAFKQADQQKVLDAFWGPGVHSADLTGKQVHGEFEDIVEFMKEVDKNGGEVPWPGTKAPDGTVIPVPAPPPPVPPLQANEICAGSNPSTGYSVDINAPSTATVKFSYRRKEDRRWRPYGVYYDEAKTRWRGDWDKQNSNYDLQYLVDGTEFITDVTTASKRPCP